MMHPSLRTIPLAAALMLALADPSPGRSPAPAPGWRTSSPLPAVAAAAPLAARAVHGGWAGEAAGRPDAALKLDARAAAVAAAEGRATVVVRLAEQADLRGAVRVNGKVARTRYVYERLVAVAERTQPAVADWLTSRGAAVERLWIVNALVVTADGPTLRALAERPDVAGVRLEGRVELIEPVPNPPSRAGQAPDSPTIVERGLKQINADEVWKLGYTGQGQVVAITDTGAAYKHPALKSAYRGAEGEHDYSWFDAVGRSPEPVDDDSHGTHVTGIAVGAAGAREIGVAPGAKWIACRLIQQQSGPDEASLKCLQWVLAPTRVDGSDPRPDLAPDVVNASWGSQPGPECGGLAEIRTAVQNLVAAGILFVAAAGNSGSSCETICAPGMYPETFTVANHDGRAIADSSSRGPIPGAGDGLIKPDIAAPGTNINSSIPPTRYDAKSGTSMASPHVAGAVALVLSARPELKGKPEIVRELMESTAKDMRPDRCGPSGATEQNNSAGHGLMDVRAAVNAALTATPPPSPTSTSTPEPTATDAPTGTSTPVPDTATPTPPPHYEVLLPLLGRRWTVR